MTVSCENCIVHFSSCSVLRDPDSTYLLKDCQFSAVSGYRKKMYPMIDAWPFEMIYLSLLHRTRHKRLEPDAMRRVEQILSSAPWGVEKGPRLWGIPSPRSCPIRDVQFAHQKCKLYSDGPIQRPYAVGVAIVPFTGTPRHSWPAPTCPATRRLPRRGRAGSYRCQRGRRSGGGAAGLRRRRGSPLRPWVPCCASPRWR